MNVVAASLPAGTVVAFAANSTPTGGFLLCNGANVSRTTYANLFAAIGTLYGTGDGSSTFALPNLTDKFIQGSGTSGTSKSAGLPNITGWFRELRGDSEPTAGGAFSITSRDTRSSDGNGTSTAQADFNASRSSSVYGASTTVQPPSVTMRYYVKY